MTKILMVGNDSSVKGGITTVIQQINSYNWKEKGIELDFIPTYIDKNNLRKILFFIKAYLKIYFYLKKEKPDKIHIHTSYKGSFTRASIIQKLALKNKVKVITHLHGSEFQKWYLESNPKKQKKIKEFIQKSTYFIVLGEVWKERITEIEKKANIIVIHNTVPIPEEKTTYQKHLQFLYLGVLIKRKGVADLLDAISVLKEEGILKKEKFLIAGSGEEKENLKKQVRELNIGKYVKFLGWINQEEKKEYLKQVQYMILPSYNEGLPMAILEAMSYGVPIISTDVGDIKEAVINKKTGYLFEKGNIKELYEILKKRIKESQIEWEKMSRQARTLSEEKFSQELFYKSFEKIYRK